MVLSFSVFGSRLRGYPVAFTSPLRRYPVSSLSYNVPRRSTHDRDEARMHFQFNVASAATSSSVTPESAPLSADLGDLLRQILETQREQVHLLKHQVAAHDAGGRWRTFLERWKEDFGSLPAAC